MSKGRLTAAEEIIKKWLAPALVGTAAATQSEDSEAGFASLLAKGANKEGALAAVGKYHDDFIDPKSAMDPHDINDAHNSLTAQYLMSKEAGNSRQGWFVGADGKPRFEFNDASASVDNKFNRKVQRAIKNRLEDGGDMISSLGLVLNHDNLFNLYPEFRKMPLIFQLEEVMGPSAAGYAPPEALPKSFLKSFPSAKVGVMQVNTDHMLDTDREELIGSLLHEAQHGIQNFEGLSAGASTSWTPDEYLSKHLDYAGKAGPKADQMHMMNDDAAKRGIEDSLSRYYYRLNAGEAEARAVELRRRLKARERAQLPPWLDYTEWYDKEPGSMSIFDFIESK